MSARQKSGSSSLQPLLQLYPQLALREASPCSTRQKQFDFDTMSRRQCQIGLLSLFYYSIVGFLSKRVLKKNWRVSPVTGREQHVHTEGVDTDKEGEVATSGANTWQLCLCWANKQSNKWSAEGNWCWNKHGWAAEGCTASRWSERVALLLCCSGTLHRNFSARLSWAKIR